MNQVTNEWLASLPEIWRNIIVAAGGLIFGLLVKGILHIILQFTTKRTDYILFRSIVSHLTVPANFFIPLLFLNGSLTLMHLTERTLVEKVVELALLASFAFVLVGAVKVFEDVIYFRNDIKKADNLKARKIRTQIEWLTRMMVAAIIVLTVAAMLLSFDNLRKIGTGLLAGVGVGSIIIGFAAQSSLSNLLAGFQIAFTQPIRLDDVVVLEGEWGKIEDITLTYVVVHIWDDRRLVLPIRYFIEKPFQNWTRVSSDIVGTVFLYLDYSVPMDRLRQKFDEILASTTLWDGKAKIIQMTDSKEKTVEIRALMSSRNSSESFDLRCLVREQLIGFLQANFPGSLPKVRAEVKNSIQEPLRDAASPGYGQTGLNPSK